MGGEDAGGRLEMEIAQPVARWRVVAERCAALTVGALLIAALGSLITGLAAPSQGVHLGTRITATGLLVMMTLSFGALGALVIARLPRLAVPVLAVVAVAGLYIPLLAPLFQWPGWVLDLSLHALRHPAHRRRLLDRARGDGGHRGDRLRRCDGGDAGARGRPLERTLPEGCARVESLTLRGRGQGIWEELAR